MRHFTVPQQLTSGSGLTTFRTFKAFTYICKQEIRHGHEVSLLSTLRERGLICSCLKVCRYHGRFWNYKSI